VDFQGIWHEFMLALQEKGGVSELTSHPLFPYLIHGNINPETTEHVWDQLVLRAGVEVLHHVLVTDVIMQDDKLSGVIIDSKAGRHAVFAQVTIDCTGDGMVAFHAGVPFEQGDGVNPYAIACTKVFRMGGVQDHREVLGEQDQKALRDLCAKREVDFAPQFSKLLGRRLPGTNSVMVASSRVLRTDPLDPVQLTKAEQLGRRQAWETAAFIQENVPGRAGSYLIDSSNHMGVRSSRRIRGRAVLKTEDVFFFKKHAQGIARGSWDIDVWPADSYSKAPVPRETAEYKARIEKMSAGEYYDIPFGCLVPIGVENLLVAGRCISAEYHAQASARIQQTCMSTGQAAGTAAALCVESRENVSELDVDKLIQVLEDDRANTPLFYIARR
jgi:hypothetical protein